VMGTDAPQQVVRVGGPHLDARWPHFPSHALTRTKFGLPPCHVPPSLPAAACAAAATVVPECWLQHLAAGGAE